jgi:diaminopimelate decarboxylase
VAAAPPALSPVWPLGTRLNARGHLEVGGCDLVELAREVGTPAYVIAEDDLRARARAFRDALRAAHGPAGTVLFASKALPSAPVERLLAEEGLGCDVASAGELHIALRAGFDPAQIVLHGNAKSPEELEAAVRAGLGHVVVDNLDEVPALEAACERVGARQPVLLRITPDVRGETHAAISTGQADSKFGVGLPDAPAAIARLRRSDRLELRGLHVHLGSQLLDPAIFAPAAAALAVLGDFPTVNMGGGLAAAYTAEDDPPSIEAWVGAQVAAVHEHLGRDRHVQLEPGRAVCANAGLTLYTVRSVRRNVSTWVGVDGGMSDNLRPMLYGARYEAHLPARMDEAREACRVAGKHCESGDVIVRDALLPAPRVGDVVAVPATGAYGHALANTYNGVPRPPVVLVRDGDARVVVRRETLEDLLARDR